MESKRISPNVLRVLLLATLIGFVFLAYNQWDLPTRLDPAMLQRRLERFGGYSPLVYMAMMVLAVLTGLFPSMVLVVAAGALFGPWQGTVYSLMGAEVGAISAFLLARHLGRGVVERFLKGHANFCARCSDRLLGTVVFITRLIPFVSFEIVSYGAGLTSMTLRAYAAATFFGMIPLTVLYSYFGATFSKHMRGPWPLLIGLVLVFLTFLVPRWIERKNPFGLARLLDHEDNGRGAR